MKKKTWYEVTDENGKLIAIRKTKKGIENWMFKHDVQRCGFWHKMNGKLIYIDYCEEYK